MLPIGDEPFGVYVQAMSADGRRVVGRGDRSAYIWDSETTYRKLDSFTATDLSGDGRFVFGVDPSGNAVRWSDDRGLENLGTIPGYAMTIRGSSFSGSTLVAEATGGVGLGVHTAIWRSSMGWVFLSDYLADHGIGTQGGYLYTSNSVSWDGNVVLGDGNRNGHRQAFVATVPEPSSAMMISLGLAALVRLRSKRLI
ncbi:MAG: PEP-CTERM sorting domain-containing protein [Fimbriimonadales bacterium]